MMILALETATEACSAALYSDGEILERYRVEPRGHSGLILGMMGWLGIPLDIMTITIAAITIGIGVDDTIHYVHRIREEFAIDNNYWTSVRRSHSSVGRAIYYTSVTITLGFSILALSNFIPSIYFGLLTGLAMLVALVANLTLLPLLIVVFKPLGNARTE